MCCLCCEERLLTTQLLLTEALGVSVCVLSVSASQTMAQRAKGETAIGVTVISLPRLVTDTELSPVQYLSALGGGRVGTLPCGRQTTACPPDALSGKVAAPSWLTYSLGTRTHLLTTCR